LYIRLTGRRLKLRYNIWWENSMSINKGLFTSTTDDWATPQDFFDKLDKEFHFDLDVCADSNNHKCEKYFTKEQDGLSQEWEGMVWCNPPYGREIGDWVAAVAAHPGGGVMLLPARTDTRWFHDYIYNNKNAEIRFVKGRLKFGGSKNSAPFPSMVVVFKKHDE
jgi:phage N-6-adenine-methyltransferase